MKVYCSYATLEAADAKARSLREAGLYAGVKAKRRAKRKIWQVYGPKQ